MSYSFGSFNKIINNNIILVQGGPKTALFLSIDNLATVKDRN